MMAKVSVLIFFVLLNINVLVNAVTIVSTNVSVNETNIIKPSNKNMIGINDNWFNGWSMSSNESLNISKQYIDSIKEVNMPITLTRMAGTESQEFRWKDSLGPLEERGFYINRGYKPNFGLLEWIEIAKKVNSKANFAFCLNMLLDTPEENADLVRFLYLNPNDPKAIGSDGVNWAQKRVDLGFAEPIEITVFELGNELDYMTYNSSDEVTAKANWYTSLSMETMAAMRRVKDDLKFSALVYTVPHDGTGYSKVWNSNIIGTLGADVSYISFHYYYHGGNNYDLLKYRLDDEIKTYIDKIPIEKRPTIYISEHAIWIGPTDTTVNKKKASSLFGTLASAQIINQMTNRTDISMMTYHCMTDGKSTTDVWPNAWAVIRKFDDNKLYVTGIGELLKTFNYGFGSGGANENIVKTTLSGNNVYYTPTSTGPTGLLTVSSHTTADGGLNLIIANQNTSVSHNITFSAIKSYKLQEENILTAVSINADNNPVTPDGLYCKSNLVNSEVAFSTYNVPAQSIIVLKLVDISKVHNDKKADICIENSTLDNEGNTVVNSLNGKLSIVGKFYNNKEMANAENVSLLILKQGVNIDDLRNLPPEALMSNVTYLISVTARRQMSYFDVTMPSDSQSGEYTAVIASRVNGKDYYETLKFLYYPTFNSNYVKNINITNASYVDGNPVISNNEYAVESSINFDQSFPIGSTYTVLVVGGNGSSKTVHIGQGIKTLNSSEYYKFLMPKDALVGMYSLNVECNGDNKNVASQPFYFEKPIEKVRITNTLVNQFEQEITIDNIKDLSKIDVPIKNVTTEELHTTVILAMYDSAGHLLTTFNKSNITLVTQESKTISIPVSIDQNMASKINYIKMYVWSGDSIRPYSETYFIK